MRPANCSRCGKKNVGPFHTCTPPKIIADSKGGHWESEDCWCNPKVEHHLGGKLVIHNETPEC